MLRKVTVAMFPYSKTIYSVLLGLIITFTAPETAVAKPTTLYQSVEQALNTNPQLQALSHNSRAARYDLKQSRGGYLPTVDLSLGYGFEQYSDDVTRKAGADPSNTDWDTRGDATVKLIQKIYDGKETGSQVSIRKAQLDSANYEQKAGIQAIALEAVTAHLNVFRQRELVTLAEKNLKVHQDIYQPIAEREQAGAGSISDVTQVQARLARAESTLYLSQAELSQAIANYTRVIGTPPGELAYAGGPETMPHSLEDALRRTEQGNPELLALDAEIVQADSNLALARSNYKPKIDLELSSRYNDQMEGDPYWQNTNAAMLILRWNLFKGGRDKAGANAALSRKHQSRSRRAAKLIELREATSTAWANYLALQRQKTAFRDAVDFSRKTFDAYLNQFTVSQRSLLDVLIVENDYFQSAVQLVTVGINETIAAYRILALGGALQIPEYSGIQEYPEYLKRLAQALVFPSIAQSNHAELQARPLNPSESLPQVSAVTKNNLALKTESLTPVSVVIKDNAAPKRESLPPISGVTEDDHAPKTKTKTTSAAKRSPLYSIEIGPCINERKVKRADKILRNLGFNARQISGTGTVRFTRLIEGVYLPHDARTRFKELKKTVSAFVLRVNKQLAICVGSFHDSDRAIQAAELLEQKNIRVIPTEFEIEMQGTILVVQPIDRKTAETIAEQISKLRLTAKVIELQDHPSSSPKESLPRILTTAIDNLAPKTGNGKTAPANLSQIYSIKIGPCINKRKLKKADEILRNHGFDARKISGSGAVQFTRLIEGVYPPHEARKRLEELKKTVSAFVLRVDKQLAICVGSFHDSARAVRAAELLEQKKIKVTPTPVEIEMQGTILVVQQIDRKNAETIKEQISKLGLTAKGFETGISS